jgi:hypothetical protein
VTASATELKTREDAALEGGGDLIDRRYFQKRPTAALEIETALAPLYSGDDAHAIRRLRTSHLKGKRIALFVGKVDHHVLGLQELV